MSKQAVGKQSGSTVIQPSVASPTESSSEVALHDNIKRDIDSGDTIPEGAVRYCPTSHDDQVKNRQALRSIAIILVFIGILLLLGIMMLCCSLYDNSNQPATTTSQSNSSNEASSGKDSQKATESIYDKSAKPIAAENLKLIDSSNGQIPDHYIGKKDAKVVVIEYADFTCPYCQDISDDMQDLRKKYQNKVLFIYRNFNIGHTYSDIAMRAAEAAYLVGGSNAYWKFNERLFNDDAWTNSEYMDTNTLESKLKHYAEEANIDANKFIDAYHNYTSNGIETKIQRDQNLGSSSNVQGTPTIIVNGKMVASYDASTVKRAIEDAID